MSWFNSNPTKNKVEIHKEKPIEYKDIDNDETIEEPNTLELIDDYYNFPSDDDADFDEGVEE